MTGDEQEKRDGAVDRMRARWLAMKTWQRAAVILLAVVVVGGLLSVNAEREQQAREREADEVVRAMTPRTVVYEVEGTAPGVSITVETPTGTSQADDRAVPLTRDGESGLSFEFTPGAFVYIAAQNVAETGTVTCRITVEGRVISENTADGAYSIATCKGQA